MENKKFIVKGNSLLFDSTLDVIESTITALNHDLRSLHDCRTFEMLDSVMRKIDAVHAYTANIVAFMHYKAFTLEPDVVLETDKDTQ